MNVLQNSVVWQTSAVLYTLLLDNIIVNGPHIQS
jgi:hypothetical protein